MVNKLFKPLKTFLLIFGFFLLIAGCGPPQVITMGSNYDPSQTSSLSYSNSTKSDVESLLGKPRGYGVARHSENQEPRNLWFYEYIQLKGSQVRIKILLVFFDQDVYEGHLWFSANELLE